MDKKELLNVGTKLGKRVILMGTLAIATEAITKVAGGAISESTKDSGDVKQYFKNLKFKEVLDLD